MSKYEGLAKTIARDIFSLGDEIDSSCQRIQFMGGDWINGNETPQGGLNEAALAQVIAKSLKRNNP